MSIERSSRELVVAMGDEVAGSVVRLRNGRLQFDYQRRYQRLRSATPLSVSMPRQIARHPDKTITPWLWGLLPENDGVLARWAREFQVSASSPFSLLSTPVGEDCAGAVRFVLPESASSAIRRAGRVRWLTEDEIAGRLKELHKDQTAWLGSNFSGQFSLAGRQAKTALLHRDGRWGVPSGSMATSHILKPAILGLDDHDLNEHLCLDAARRAGLVAARTAVRRFADETAIVIERYDRRESDVGLVRIHQEDVAQALGYPPSRKYQNEGGPGAREIIQLFRRTMPPPASDDATWRFVDALAWNWIIGGTDAHAKNYSLLLAGDDVRLAPLYDIASALPYDIHPKKLKLAMKLGGEYRLKAHNTRTWLKEATELGLDIDEVRTRVRMLTTAAPQAFSDAAAERDVKSLRSSLPSRLVDAVAHRSAECERLVA